MDMKALFGFLGFLKVIANCIKYCTTYHFADDTNLLKLVITIQL